MHVRTIWVQETFWPQNLPKLEWHRRKIWYICGKACMSISGSCHKRQKPQAPTPQAPIRNRQTRKVANAKGLNRNTNLT